MSRTTVVGLGLVSSVLVYAALVPWLSELDPAKRHDMYCEMQTLIHEGSGMVIPAFSNINDGIANNVMGMPTVPLGQLGGCEWPEFIWLA